MTDEAYRPGRPLPSRRPAKAVRADPKWRKKLTDEDQRGLSALFWTHLNLYSRSELDMNNHLELDWPGGRWR